jgi:hypothetical protein
MHDEAGTACGTADDDQRQAEQKAGEQSGEPAVDAVGKHGPEPVVKRLDALQQVAEAVSILDVGRMHEDAEQQPVGGRRALMEARGSEAFPLPRGRVRGTARGDPPLAVLAPAERQAVIAAIADIRKPPQGVNEVPPFGYRAVLETAWRFDCEHLVRRLDRASRSWLRARAGAWQALQQRVNAVWQQQKPQRASSALGGRAAGRRPQAREAARHRGLAEAILCSDMWRASGGQPAARRRRRLGRLMWWALEAEIPAELGQNYRERG